MKVENDVRHLARILERQNYPLNRTFYKELFNALKKQTGCDRLNQVCYALLEQKIKMSQ